MQRRGIGEKEKGKEGLSPGKGSPSHALLNGKQVVEQCSLPTNEVTGVVLLLQWGKGGFLGDWAGGRNSQPRRLEIE